MPGYIVEQIAERSAAFQKTLRQFQAVFLLHRHDQIQRVHTVPTKRLLDEVSHAVVRAELASMPFSETQRADDDLEEALNLLFRVGRELIPPGGPLVDATADRVERSFEAEEEHYKEHNPQQKRQLASIQTIDRSRDECGDHRHKDGAADEDQHYPYEPSHRAGLAVIGLGRMRCVHLQQTWLSNTLETEFRFIKA